jgi:hypothetical protein
VPRASLADADFRGRWLRVGDVCSRVRSSPRRGRDGSPTHGGHGNRTTSVYGLHAGWPVQMWLSVHPHPHQFAVLLRYYRAANLAVIRPFRKTAEARCRSHQMHRLTTTRALGTFVPVRPGEWIGARLIHDCCSIACLGRPNIDLRQVSIPMCGASALGSDAQSSAMLIIASHRRTARRCQGGKHHRCRWAGFGGLTGTPFKPSDGYRGAARPNSTS